MNRRLSVPLGLLAMGCVGAPSPLAPSLRGTVGVPHQGVQTEAVELPVNGEGFARFRPKGRNHWATPRLVNAVMAAAAHVAKAHPDGQPLVVGDFSARHGGKIPGHNSHRTGRDVDLLYYVTTPSGAPVRSPGFVSVESDGLAKVHESDRYVRIDVPRNWALVKHLLENSEVGVQFLFASRNVEALLIDYALSRQEPLELVYRAQTVLLEPKDSTPHDDHLHLRIACAPDEGVSGCTGGGPYWQWLPPASPSLPLEPAVFAAIATDDPPPAFESLAESSARPPGGV
jgi:penicillin-insensitive murein endopeptidase